MNSEILCIPSGIIWMRSMDTSQKDIERLLAFEMKCYRRILHISWKDRVTNEKVREKVAIQKSQLLTQVKRLKLGYIGHTKKHPSLERTILEGTMEGIRGRGRPRAQWVDSIEMWMGMSAVKAGRLAQDRSSPGSV